MTEANLQMLGRYGITEEVSGASGILLEDVISTGGVDDR